MCHLNYSLYDEKIIYQIYNNQIYIIYKINIYNINKIKKF